LRLRDLDLAVEESLRGGDLQRVRAAVNCRRARHRAGADLTLKARRCLRRRAEPRRTCPQAEEAREQRLRRLCRGAAAKWAEVATRSTGQPAGDREPRKGIVDRQLEERDLWEVLAEAIVRRLAAANLFRLAQGRFELGAGDLDVDGADVADEIEHLAPMGAGIGEVGADPLAQI